MMNKRPAVAGRREKKTFGGITMDLVLKIAALGIIVGIAVQVLNKTGREDIAMLAGIAGLVAVGLMIIKLVAEMFTQIQALFTSYS